MTVRSLITACLLVIFSVLVILKIAGPGKTTPPLSPLDSPVVTASASALILLSPTPTPKPTPKPLSFKDQQALYGPCAYVPTLMYHRIQDQATAAPKHQQSVSFPPDVFRSQLSYLKDHGYTTIFPADLIAFFDHGTPLPPKPVMITLDDGYDNVYTVVFPLLREFNFKAVSFLPTGLMENGEYLKWSQIQEMAASGLVYFGNHTWSHASTATNVTTVTREITTADQQLNDRGLNQAKVFAYPYGSDSTMAENVLRSINYSLAFTTHTGSIQCNKHRLSLPRLRVGATPLSQYGL